MRSKSCSQISHFINLIYIMWRAASNTYENQPSTSGPFNADSTGGCWVGLGCCWPAFRQLVQNVGILILKIFVARTQNPTINALLDCVAAPVAAEKCHTLQIDIPTERHACHNPCHSAKMMMMFTSCIFGSSPFLFMVYVGIRNLIRIMFCHHRVLQLIVNRYSL